MQNLIWYIVYTQESHAIISIYNICLSLKIAFVIANSADPDEFPFSGISSSATLFAIERI